MIVELMLLMALNTNNITIAQNRNDCPVINGATRCDLKGKNCRYDNGRYVCEKKSS